MKKIKPRRMAAKAHYELFKMPKSFHPHTGKCTWQRPLVLCRESDLEPIILFHRDGSISESTVDAVNWKTTFLKEDVIGWKLKRGCEDETN